MVKEEQNQSSEGRSGESQLPDLLPCPFCGKDAALTNVRMANHTFRVGCYNEFCGVRSTTDYYGSRTQPSTAQEAIEAWNTRAEDTAALRQRIRELEKQVDELRRQAATPRYRGEQTY